MLERHIWRSEPANPQGASLYEESFSIADIKRLIRKYWTTVAKTTVASTLAAGLYISIAAPVFTATARLLLEPKSQIVLDTTTKENLITLDTPHVESQLAILKSQRIAAIVVRRLGERLYAEADNPGIWAGLSGIFSSKIEPDELNTNRTDRIVAGVQKQIDAQRQGLSFAIDISYASRDPELAASVVNAVVDAYIEDQLAAQAAAARQGAEWLEGRIARLRKEINATAVNLKELKAKRDYRIGSRKYADASADGPNKPGKLEAPEGDLMTMEELELRYDTYRKLYESYLAAYWQSVQQQSSPFSTARAISRAIVPMESTYPRTLLILAFASAVGLFAGLGLALVRHSLKIGE